MKFVPGCSCCCAVASITADAKCGGSGASLTSVTFDLRDAADTTTLATTSGSSATFTGLDGSLSYKVRVSKTGYHTKTSTTITPGCGGSSSVTVSTWPTTATLNVHAQLTAPTCGHAGASVAITGDATASGTTDSSGDVAISITTSSSSVTQSLTITVTSPAGTGSTPAVVGVTFNACTGLSQTVTVNHDGTHVGKVCGQRYLPTTLSYSDDYGSCTLTSSGSDYTGSYSYSSSVAIKRINCGGADIRCVKDQTLSIPVSVSLAATGVCNGSATFQLLRTVYVGARGSCVDPADIACQVTDSDCASTTAPNPVLGSFDCSTTSISWTGSMSGFSGGALGCAADIPETDQGTITITGTI